MDNQSLEKRVAELEKEVAELKAEARKGPGKDDWRSTVGWAKDDPTYEEAMKLGAKWRRRVNNRSLRAFDRQEAREKRRAPPR